MTPWIKRVWPVKRREGCLGRGLRASVDSAGNNKRVGCEAGEVLTVKDNEVSIAAWEVGGTTKPWLPEHPRLPWLESFPYP